MVRGVRLDPSVRRFLSVLAVALVLIVSPHARAQQAPPPDIPPEFDPLLTALAPAGWAACEAVGIGGFAVVALPGLLPVPIPVPLPVSPSEVLTVFSPLNASVLQLCRNFGLPPTTPACTFDANFAVIPLLAPKVVGVTVNQLLALEQTVGVSPGTLASLVIPVGGCVVELAPPPSDEPVTSPVEPAPPPMPDVNVLPDTPPGSFDGLGSLDGGPFGSLPAPVATTPSPAPLVELASPDVTLGAHDDDDMLPISKLAAGGFLCYVLLSVALRVSKPR